MNAEPEPEATCSACELPLRTCRLYFAIAAALVVLVLIGVIVGIILTTP